MTSRPYKKLDGPRILAEKGVAKRLVIILHGYGADGNNLIGLGDYWREKLPGTTFVAPNGPEVCEDFPFGYQWFSLPDRDMSKIATRAKVAAPTLKNFIQEEMAFHTIDDLKNVALVGFSQGAMLSLYTAIYELPGLVGVIGYSGGFIADNDLKPRNKPNVLLYHGDADYAVSVDASRIAQEQLKSLNIDSELVIESDMGHEISEAGLEKGLAFLKQTFKI